MKRLFILITSACLIICASTSCSKTSKRINEFKRTNYVGLNAREVREDFIKQGYKPTEINYASIFEQELVFNVRLREPSEFDWFEYGTGIRLRPWRYNMISHIVFRATLDEEIYKVEYK